MIIMLIITITICILFTIVELISVKKKPLAGLHNLPKDIQERVHLIPEYEKKIGKILSTKERIIKKVPALVVILFVFAALVHMAGANSFFEGFLYTFIMWTFVKMYVALVLMCGWYAHTPSVWIKGTEDMASSYQNYVFYLSSVSRSLLAGAGVSVIIGFMMMWV